MSMKPIMVHFSCHSGNFYDMNVNAMVNLYFGANKIQWTNGITLGKNCIFFDLK
jgi:hypothetical protein